MKAYKHSSADDDFVISDEDFVINEEDSNQSQSDGSEFVVDDVESGSEWEGKNKVALFFGFCPTLC